MSKYFRIIFANMTSLLLTALIVAGVIFLIIKLNTFVFMPTAQEGEIANDNLPISQTERIDTQQVEDELNRIAEAKRLEAERIAREKAEQERQAREKAERERQAREKAERERIAKEKAEQERQARIEKERLEKIAREKAEAEQVAKEKAEKAKQAQIAKEKAAQAEKERIAREKAEQAKQAQIAKEKAEQERQAKIAREKAEAVQRQDRIDAALNTDYQNLVKNYLHERWIVPALSNHLSATVLIHVDTNGNVIGTPEIIVKSGNEIFDKSVIHAIRTARSIPMPKEPLAREILAKEGLEITFSPEQ